MSPAAAIRRSPSAELPGEAMTLDALSALGQSTRLRIFRFLMTRAPDAVPAGLIAEAVGVLQNTLSNHLGILARAGLISGVRDGRLILYRADFDAMRDLVGYLLTDCCGGHPEVCAPIFETLQGDCGCGPRTAGQEETRRGAD